MRSNDTPVRPKRPRTWPCRAALAVVLLVVVPTAALAQARARVTRDRANIWRPGFTAVVAVVDRDTVLEVRARVGDWYEVVLPSGRLGAETTGLIAASQVELVSGSGLPPPVQPAE